METGEAPKKHRLSELVRCYRHQRVCSKDEDAETRISHMTSAQHRNGAETTVEPALLGSQRPALTVSFWKLPLQIWPEANPLAKHTTV